MQMTYYSLNKTVFWQQDPDTPGRSPETPDMKSGESGLGPGESGPLCTEHRKTVVNIAQICHILAEFP